MRKKIKDPRRDSFDGEDDAAPADNNGEVHDPEEDESSD